MKTSLLRRHKLLAFVCAAATPLAATAPAFAISIQLKDVAADRVDRQRMAAEGDLPLPGTPNLADLNGRLTALGLSAGDPVFIRVFKAESELELWMLKDGEYVRFATYPICYWSGTLGPKQREGDRQSPEGFYSLTEDQLHRGRRWKRSLNVGYPNAFDRAQAWGGSFILVHGGCNSIGCFAMTNGVMEEVYDLTQAALAAGQAHVPLHAFPFRMTEANLEKYKDSAWNEFWRNLKEGYDSFESTRRPPNIGICEDRYEVAPVAAAGPALPGPMKICGAEIAAVELLDRLLKVKSLRPSAELDRIKARREAINAIESRRGAALVRGWAAVAKGGDPSSGAELTGGSRKAKRAGFNCSFSRASCRKFVALQRKVASRKGNKRVRTASRGR